ncbi:MAG: tRNA (adenosine(37)-N6)-threonylcarbamoyltransferase complex transferase subunit TsaD [Oscillospiraceae bacterium]|jgi:N6-L-threonylcarbamoyladenine synthase
MLVLGIESSCDETAAAVVEDGRVMKSNAVASQIPVQRLYGGVVPEIASRMHVENIVPVVREALSGAGAGLHDIDAVAVTAAPGLIGALLVGVNFAKGLAYACGKPLVPVHHIRGHIAAAYLTEPDLKPPFIALAASGGHSHFILVKDYTEFEVLGRAVDDAAGEAFDKVARAMGLPYPGGPEISKAAVGGDPSKYPLPDPRPENPLDVSFSGLKTAVINIINQDRMKGEKTDVSSLAASFEHRAVGMLAGRLAEASDRYGLPGVMCGGVAANKSLRALAEKLFQERGRKLYCARADLCGDNGAMIAAAGYYEYMAGSRADYGLNAYPTMEISDSFGTCY